MQHHAALLLTGALLPIAPAQTLAGAPATKKWTIVQNKARPTLELKDEGGVLTGTLTDDPQWGGRQHPVQGVHAKGRIMLHYKTTKAFPDGGSADAQFFVIAQSDPQTGRLAGSVTMIITSHRDGRDISNTETSEWTGTLVRP
jgi:hypothetical protein